MNSKDNFEVSLKELESVVKSLESGDIGLDEMLALYEKGIKLTKTCTKLIDSAEQKINILVQSRENGELEAEPFKPLED